MIGLFIDVVFVSREVLFVIFVRVRVGRLLRVLLHEIDVYVSVDGCFLVNFLSRTQMQASILRGKKSNTDMEYKNTHQQKYIYIYQSRATIHARICQNIHVPKITNRTPRDTKTTSINRPIIYAYIEMI